GPDRHAAADGGRRRRPRRERRGRAGLGHGREPHTRHPARRPAPDPLALALEAGVPAGRGRQVAGRLLRPPAGDPAARHRALHGARGRHVARRRPLRDARHGRGRDGGRNPGRRARRRHLGRRGRTRRVPVGAVTPPGSAAAARPGMMPPVSAADVVWDLSPLYAGPDDPRLEADMAEAARAAAAFAARHRGRLATIAAGELARALVEYETIEELGRRPSFYASLLFAADTASEAARRLVERTREAWIDVVNELTAFEIEIKELSDERYAALVAAPALASARHWMDDLRRLRPHTLSEAEERLINEKNLAGRDAFVRLFDELTSSLRFRVEVDGAVRTLTGEETLALLHQPDAQLRERAHTAFLETHAEHGLVLASIFNAILYDQRLECELRRYADPATPTHLENEVRPATVEAMMAATEGHYPLAQRYFRL